MKGKATKNGQIKRWKIEDTIGFDVELRGKYSGIYIEALNESDDIFIGVGTRREFTKADKTGAHVSFSKLRKVLDKLQEKLTK